MFEGEFKHNRQDSKLTYICKCQLIHFLLTEVKYSY